MNAIVTFLEPVFQWWKRFEQAYSGTGFMVFVYGAAWLIGWMFTRLQPTRLQPETFSILIIRHILPPPLSPPIVGRPEPFENDDSDSFAA
jgi:hypothetical protein